MNLAETLRPGGTGVIATASKEGVPNTAIYATPHIVDETTLAWGLTEGRTRRNLSENPNAAYLYISPGGGNRGVRLALRLRDVREADPLLNRIREGTRDAVSHEAGDSIRYVAFFDVTEIRPLV